MPLSNFSYQYNVRPPDHGLLAWNFDGPSAATGSLSPLGTAGTLYVQKINVPAPSSITNVVYYLQGLGSVLTSGQCFVALYQNNALVGVSADQSVVWVGSTGIKTTALASGPFSVQAGYVYVAFWFNGTLGPAFLRSSGFSAIMNTGLSSPSLRWSTADTGKTTTAPATLAAMTAAGNAYWVALS